MKTLFSRQISSSEPTKSWLAPRADSLSLVLLGAVALSACGADGLPESAQSKQDRLNAQAAQAAAGPYKKYVALGDSFVAGDGIVGNTTSCHLSDKAWPHLLADSLAVGGTKPVVKVAACSGATTTEIQKKNTKKSQPPQIDAIKGADATNLITITIGGNDLPTGGELSRCILGNCESRRDAIKKKIEGTVAKKLKSTFAAMRKAAPKATIVATGYPMLVSADISRDSTCKSVLTAAEVTLIRDAVAMTNEQIRIAAKAAGMIPVIDEVVKEFAGHEACSGTGQLITTLDLKNPGTTLHPNEAGNAAFARAVKAGLAGAGVVNRHVDPASDGTGTPQAGTDTKPSAAGSAKPAASPSNAKPDTDKDTDNTIADADKDPSDDLDDTDTDDLTDDESDSDDETDGDDDSSDDEGGDETDGDDDSSDDEGGDDTDSDDDGSPGDDDGVDTES